MITKVQPIQVTIESSSLLGWLSLASSLVLAVITLWYVIITAKTLRQAQLVEADRQRRDRERQAADVSAWVSNSQVANRTAIVEIKIRNSTNQAVYDVILSLHDLEGGVLKTDVQVGVVGPEQEVRRTVNCNLPENAGGQLRTGIEFIDGQGIPWERGVSGKLIERQDPASPR